jgi:putative transcriptional regulator
MKNRLKVVRRLSKLTQQQLAYDVGISRQSLSAIENNRQMPSVLITLKLAKALKIPSKHLFYL